MNCPSCDGKNRDDARFCKFCGADLFSRCRMCGALLDDDARFCDACGTPAGDVAATRAPAAAPAPAAVAARKVVTVLFADLSGSTALEERMDAESVRSILDRFYAAMRSEVERYGGKVVKFTGDGVMAAFGVPEVHEDDAARAVDASLAMREELEQLASDLSLDVALNIGVNTGEVVVSETDDDVVGDAVNVAARLEGAATGGEILVGEETWRLTRATSRYEPVEPLTLKGKSEPVPAYRLLSVDERTADSAAAPFVGREAELGRLLNVFQECVDANAARLVTIIGSPGLGKTRLARELMSELSDSARVRETRCDPAGGSTFAPIADALRAGSGISETDTEEEIVAALAARLPDDDPDRERVAQRAASIFGAGVPGTTEETFWALRKLIEAAAHIQPVVFVLDDIHWAEPLLLDLVEHLAEWIRDAPVLLVGTARPELRDLRPSLVEGGRAAAVIALEGLDRAATAQLALNLLEADSLPEELLAKIPASTEGNPLFVRELVRMLVDDDVLRRTSDGWEVTVDVEAIQVPPTIQSLLSARVDRLRNDERTVVELASVVGKEFYRGAIVDLAPDHVKELVDGCLESLRRKELVEPVGTYWIDEPVYRFHHVLIRDAAYRRVLKERRAELHERVAVWLERKTENILGEHDELLGYHLEQAHQYKQELGRPDEALGGRAADLLGTAAQRALESDDLPAAATLSGRALDRLGFDDPKRSELLLVRCEALLSMGDVVHGSPAVSEFASLADAPRLAAWATCFSGQLANLTSSERLQETESAVAAAASELTELGDQAGAAKAHTVHASTLAGLGRFAECEAVLDLALTAARAANDRRRITATLGSAPHAALWGPNPVSRAGGRCLDIVRLLRITTGSPAVEATSLRCQAVLEAFRGRAEAARRMLGSARRTLTELGLQHELLEAEQFAGIVELVDGDAAAAQLHLAAAHEGFRRVGVDVLAAQSAAQLARAHLMLGEDLEAEAYVGTSEQLGSQDLKTAIAWRSVKAELLARRGEFDEARRLAQEAVELAERTDALIDHGNACRSLGAVLRAAGDAAGAKGAEDRALALFERKGATALIEGAAPAQPERAAPVVDVAPTTVAAVVQNASSRRLRQYTELFARRAWDELLAISAPDGVMEDRRVGMSWVVVGANPGIESLKAMAEMGTVRIDVEPLATRGDRLSVNRWIARGRGSGGFETEMFILVEVDAQDRVAALIVFAVDDLDGALAELDARDVPAGLSNVATIVNDRIGHGLAARDWAAIERLVTEDIVFVDRRRGLQHETHGRDEYMDLMRSLASIGTHRFGGDVIALRGDRHMLARLTTIGPDGRPTTLQTQFLSVQTCDLEGRLAQMTNLDPGDVGAALTELDARYVSDLTPADAAVVQAFAELTRSVNERDWDAVRNVFADSVVTHDHRPASLGQMSGPDRWIESFKSLVSIWGDHRGHVVAYHRLDAGVCALQLLNQGTTDEGGSVETTLHIVGVVRNGRIAHWEHFPIDALEAALARFEELSSESSSRHLENACVHVGMEFQAAFARRDFDEMRAQVAEDAVYEDRRAGLGNLVQGREPFITNLQAIADLGPVDATLDVIAIRGERLALANVSWRVTDPNVEFEVDTLNLVELGEYGLFTAVVSFDREDVEAAVAELDERFASGEGRDHAAVVRILGRFQHLYNTRGWDSFRELLTGDLIVVDHRPVSLDQLHGADAYVRVMQVLVDLVPGRRGVTADFPAISAGGCVGTFEMAGASEDGVETTETMHVLSMVVDGRISRSEVYPADRLADAIARFEELDRSGKGVSRPDFAVPPAALGSASGLRNECVHVLEEGWARYERSTAENLGAFGMWIGSTYGADGTHEDRRRGLRSTLTGADAIAQAFAAAPRVVSEVRRTVLGTRGERLALARVAFVGPDEEGFENEMLWLQALRPDGTVRRTVLFDDDSIDEAFALLDELYVADEGSRDAPAFGVIRRLIDSLNAHDWAPLRGVLTGDFSIVDRRPVSLGEINDPDAYVQSIVVMGADHHERTDIVAVPRIGPQHVLFEIVNHFVMAEESEVERWVLMLVTIRDDHVSRIEAFDIDQRDAALAQFAALHLGPASDGSPPENASARVARTFWDLYAREDWEGLRNTYTEDHVTEDMRPGLRATYVGADENLANLRALRAVGGEPAFFTPIATRGDRIAIIRYGITSPSDDHGFASDVLVVNQLSAAGHTRRAFIYEADDLDRALARADELFVEDEGRIAAEAIDLTLRILGTTNARDWNTQSALLTDDFVLTDHRPVSLGVMGKDEFLDSQRAIWDDLLPDLRFHVTGIPLFSRDGVVTVLRGLGTREGAEIEWAVSGFVRVRGGKVSSIDFFPADALDRAIAAFRERVPSDDRGLTSACVRVVERYLTAFGRQDWAAMEAELAPDVLSDDRRSGLSLRTTTSAELVGQWRLAVDVAKAIATDVGTPDQIAELRLEAQSIVVATRGERLALARMRVGATDIALSSFEVDVLTLYELTDDGVIGTCVGFDADALDDAIAELDERYLAGEGRPYAAVIRANRENLAMINARDWQAYGANAADDFVVVDHRPASLGELDKSGLIAANQGLVDLIPDLRIETRRYLALEADRSVSEIGAVGHTPDGDPLDLTIVVVGQLRDGKVSRAEYYPPDQVDDALARFEELGSRSDDSSLENGATRFVRRLGDTMNTGTLDEFVDLHDPSFTLDDRRAGLRHIVRGLDEIRRYWAMAREDGLGHVERSTFLAIRGDRLALSRRVYKAAIDGADFESERLIIDEVDDSGRVVSATFFDPDDLDAAFAELDERYVAGEMAGTPEAGMIRSIGEFFAGYNRRDWKRCAEILTPDFVLVDQRPLGAGTLRGTDEAIRYLRVMVDQAPDIQIRFTRFVSVTPTTALWQLWAFGTTTDGVVVEIAHHLVMKWDGRLARVEIYPLDQLEDARARLGELSSTGATAAVGPRAATPVLENSATRTWDAMCINFAEQRWDEHTKYLSPDVVTEDRRPGLQNVITGVDAFLEVAKTIRTITSPGPVLETKVLAVRGDRLALYHELYHPPAGYPQDMLVELLGIVEVDERGLLVRVIDFEVDDTADAFAELDERYASGEGAPFATGIRLNAAAMAMWNTGDWDGFPSLFHPDVGFVDHRPFGVPETHGLDAVVDLPKAMAGVAPDIRHDVATYLAIDTHAFLTDIRAYGTNDEGGSFENEYLQIGVHLDGRISGMERFAVDQRPAALRRFEELRDASTERVVPNEAFRTIVRGQAAAKLGDWDAVANVFADNVVTEDRRAGLGSRVEGRAAVVEHLKVVFESEVTFHESLVATRGERLFLARESASLKDFEAETITVTALDDDGRCHSIVHFDPGDEDRAFAELDERYLRDEGAPYAASLRSALELFKAYNTRDWDEYTSRVTEDFLFVDHRPASAGTQVAQTHVEYLQVLIDLAPDVSARVVEIPRVAADRVLTNLAIHGTTREGAEIELPIFVLHVLRDGRMCRLETFPLEQRGSALARFEELGPRPDDDHPCHHWRERRDRLIKAGEWDALTEMYAEDVVFEDHRRGLGTRISGRAAVLEHTRVATPGTTMRSAPLATRGDRLALVHCEVTIDSGYEVELLLLHELGADGRQIYNGVFDPDDLETAIVALEDRFVAGEGAAGADFVRRQQRMTSVVTAGDWDAYRSLVADDVVVVDNRPASMGEIRDADELVRSNRVLFDLMGGWDLRVMSIIRARGGTGVSRLIVEGRNSEGGAVNLDQLIVARFADGLLRNLEYFPPERIEDALERCDELGADDDVRPPLANACTALWDRVNSTFNDRTWDGSGDEVSADIAFEDRRAGLINRTTGREAYVQQVQVVVDMGAENRSSVIAVRGERLALVELDWYDPADRVGATINVLHLHQLDGDGRIGAVVVFDPEDLDAAFAELDERFANAEAGEAADIVRLGMRTLHVWNGQDWDALEALWEPDGVFVDHRQLSPGEVGLDDLMSMIKNLADLMPDVRHRVVAMPRLGRGILLTETVAYGTNAEGGRVDFSYLQIVCAPRGRYSRVERFELDRYDDAVARFDELTRPEAGRLENAATRAARRSVELILADDFASYAAELAPDVVFEDRRALLRHESQGPEALLEQLRALRSVGTVDIRQDVIATRGDRLGLMRTRVVNGDVPGFDVDALSLVEVDELGRSRYVAIFDPDDLDAAFAELDERFAAQAGGSVAPIVRMATKVFAAFNAHEWDTYAERFSPDVVVVDHQFVGAGEIVGRKAMVEYAKLIIVELASNVREDLIAFHAIDERGGVGEIRAQGENAEGGLVEFAFLYVGLVLDGYIARFEIFPAERLEDALARYRELTDQPDVPSRDGHRFFGFTRELDAFCARGDWDAVAAFYAPDVVFEDRRTGLRTRSVGADHVVNQMQSIWADIQRWDRELIATRGPRLALSRNLYVSGEGFEVELLSVLGYDGAGRQSSITAFEANDVDDAFAELDRLYTSLNGSGSTAAWQNLLRWRDARSRGDWDAFERQLTDDCVYVDHRPSLTQELVGREAVMAVARNPLSADSQQRMIAIHAIDDELILVESIAHGTNSEGGAVEVAYMNIFGFRDGNVRRVERYAPEDLEQALLRFHELSPDHGEAARLRRRVTDAVNDRDWDSFIACFSPRMVFKDHRPVGFGESIGAPRAWGPGIVELIPDARIETAAIFHMDDRGGVGQMVIRGHDTHGNPVEHTWVDVTVVHDGVVTRHEHFPPERVDDALARYRELTDGI